jgi:uncharacterized membrane protein YuzA (DUF378 family)
MSLFWGIAVFIGAIFCVAALNKSKSMQRAFSFDRPMPVVDRWSLIFLVGGGVLLLAQALFNFTLFDLLPRSAAWIIYGLIGFSAVWQGSRQR